MWVLPSEYKHLLPPQTSRETPNGDSAGSDEDDTDGIDSGDDVGNDVGDGSDLLEISARDLARRCLEIIGIELGLGLAS